MQLSRILMVIKTYFFMEDLQEQVFGGRYFLGNFYFHLEFICSCCFLIAYQCTKSFEMFWTFFLVQGPGVSQTYLHKESFFSTMKCVSTVKKGARPLKHEGSLCYISALERLLLDLVSGFDTQPPFFTFSELLLERDSCVFHECCHPDSPYCKCQGD